MSNQSDTTPNLRLHIEDLQEILASIALDKSEHVESAWYEVWDTVLNYWIRRSSDGDTRLSVAPQRQIIREIMISDDTGVEADANWSFEADDGGTSTELSGNTPNVQQRIHDAHDGINTQSRIPDFTAFALRRYGVPHRRLLCIMEIKARTNSSLSVPTSAATPQIISQAKFAFDSFPKPHYVFSIFAVGDSWCLLRFPRDEVTQLYLKHVEEWKGDNIFKPERAPSTRRNLSISKFVVIRFSKILNGDKSHYSASFKRAIELITASLK